jgi:hypothetical protein
MRGWTDHNVARCWPRLISLCQSTHRPNLLPMRKAAARRLAEAGCTPHQIASITGHKTLGEIERYTKAADQVRMARAAIGRIGQNVNKSGKPR